MAKNNITQYDATAANNTDIDSINIDEGMAASDVNNALRSLMSHLKNVDTGSQALTALSVTGNVTVAGNIQKTSGNLTIDVADDITLDAGGGDVNIADDGTTIGVIANDGSSNFVVKSSVQDKDIIFKGNDGGSTITAMTIDMSEGGFVGIRTSIPSNTLEIKSATNDDGIRLSNEVGSYHHLIRSNGDGLLFDADAGSGGGSGADIRFQVKGSEKARIDSNGVAIFGLTAQISNGDQGCVVDGATGSIATGKASTNARTHISFINPNGTVGSITTTNSATAFNTSSDYRLKENVTDVTDGITRVKQLAPKRFNFIANADTTVDGFIAHEAATVVPEAIYGTKDEVEVWKDGDELPDGVSVGDNKLDDDGKTIPVMQAIDQSKLVPLLTAALQEAIAKIEQLEARITALENA